MKASELVVGQIYRIKDGRTGILVLVRNNVAYVRMPRGDNLLLPPGQLKALS